MRNNNSKKTMVNRAIKISAATLILIALFTIIFSSSPVRAAGNTGRISGQLLDGTNKNAPLAGQSVTLQMAQGNTASDLASATTDAHGSFNFANLATDKSTSYAVYISYQGAQYTTGILTLDTKPVQQVNLTVYEATTSFANIAVARATILLHKPDAQNGVVSVSELYIFRNLDTHTYVGSLDASQGKPNALRFSLPHTARNVTLGKGFDGYKAIQVDRGFASDAAVPPGDSQFSFTFDMPYSTPSYDFDYTVAYPTVQLTFLVPPEISAISDSLASQGPITSNQNRYSLFLANALLAEKEVHLELAGLPTLPLVPTLGTSPSTASSNAVPPWLLIALMMMVTIVLVTWLVARAVLRPAPWRKKVKS
jgi:hypothetical protein